MKNILLACAVSLFNITTVFCQNIVYDSLKAYIPNLPTTFFLIQANTILETYTQSAQIIERTEEIRKNQLCKTVVYLFSDGAGIGENNILQYVSQNFNITTDSFTHVLINERIYSMLGSPPNTQVHYFYETTKINMWDGKYETIPQKPLPYNLVEIVATDTIPLKNESQFMHSNKSTFYPIDEKLAIELFDSHHSRVRIIDITTGEIVKVLEESKTNYTSVLLKYLHTINFDTSGVISGINYLNSIKRSSFKTSLAKIVSTEEIYLLGDVSFVQKSKNASYIPGEFDSVSIKIKPNEMVQYVISFVLKTNSKFDILDFFLFDELSQTKYNKNNLLDPTSLFFRDSTYFYCMGYSYNEKKDKTYKQFYKKNEHTQFVHRFKLQNKLLIFDKKEPVKFVHPFEKFYFYLDVIQTVQLKSNYYFIDNTFPEVYELKSEYPKTVLREIPQDDYSFSQNNYDTTSVEKIPFYLLAMEQINDLGYVKLFYRFEDKYFIEIRDYNFDLVQRIDFTSTNILRKEMKKTAYYYAQTFFTNNYLYTMHCSGKNGCNFYRYRLKFKF